MKLLERSVEELECTINVLENKVSSEMCFFNVHAFSRLSCFMDMQL